MVEALCVIDFTDLDNDVMFSRLLFLNIGLLNPPLTVYNALKLLVVFIGFPIVAWATPDPANRKDTAELDDVVLVAEEAEEVVLEQSAAAVDVINIKADQKLTADLSEVLSREPGISIRRMGGLGSRERFSLNGLGDEQIRFFIDDIPLEMSGYTYGVGTIPVNLIQRADIYHGVVPIKFGTDALGGAVNLITDKGQDGTGGSISHMTGDFGTNRSTVNLKYVDDRSGFFSRLNGFYDYTDNNYTVDVTVPNKFAQILPYRGKRFHDVYEGKGVNFDLGVRGQRWSDLFQLGVYSSEYYDEIQHDLSMNTVYGEPTIERKKYGLNLKYQLSLYNNVELNLIAGASEAKSEFIDIGTSKYLWNGQKSNTPFNTPGEINEPCQCIYWRNRQSSIMHLQWNVAQGHSIEWSAAPAWNKQTARNHFLPDKKIDATNADRTMFSLISGMNYTVDLDSDRFQNQFFIKYYQQDRESDEPDTLLQKKIKLKSGNDRFGWGNGIRYRFYDWLLGKVSYEQATRLPAFEEVFGNAVDILSNLNLNEEYSNNYNVSLKVSDWLGYGSWNGEVNLFLRDVEDAIVLMRSNGSSEYRNVASVDSQGFQLSMAWFSPEDFINISANFTDYRLINTSRTGRYASFRDQKIPNQPYTFFNTKTGLKFRDVFSAFDEFSLEWNYRYVGRFELFWEGQGNPALGKPFVQEQSSHSLAATYSKDFFPYVFTLTTEVQNLTDQKLFDYYGVQRPGRAFYVKAIFEF